MPSGVPQKTPVQFKALASCSVFSKFLKEFTRGPAADVTLKIGNELPLCVEYTLRERSFLRFHAAPQGPDYEDFSEEDLVMD